MRMKKVKEFFLNLWKNGKERIIYASVIVIVILFVLMLVMLFRGNELAAEVDHLKAQKEELTTVMQKDKDQMQEQITLLSNQVAEQIAREEKEAEKFYPNGLPVSGKVTIEDEPVENSEVSSEMMNDKELRKMVIFGAANDAKVMAAGSGKVTSIKRDTEFGYAVRIDHGNGYITIYRYNDQPKIKEGDDVTKGQLLFEVGFASSKVGYQIMYDNEYINPMDIMEING